MATQDSNSILPTNMYNKTPPPNLNQILANLSVGDTKHDFGSSFISDQQKDDYNSGLPMKYTNIMDEPGCLNSVIKNYTIGSTVNTNNNTYLPISIANPGYESGKNSQHTIETINGYNYTVNYTDVKPRVKGNEGTNITGPQFFENLDITDNNIAIVVDAASIKLTEILSTGTFTTGTRRNVYYIYGPEVVNDPATKKHPEDLIENNSNGVKFVPCISTNPQSFVYDYNFTTYPSENTIYLEQFFTKYNFALSEIIPASKGRSISYTTNLTISDKENGKNINPIIDSKSKNDITFLTKFISDAWSFLSNRKANTPEKSNNQFLLSSGYQQKRSGDWLQVLLCSSLRDKSRGIKLYPGTTPSNLIKEVERVFFVTHDQIALAFALLNGIDCIFTHHNGKHHFHSAFVYKLNDPVTELRNKSILVTSIKSGENKIKITTLFNKVKTEIDTYMTNVFDANVITVVNNLNTTLDEITGKLPNTASQFDVNIFNENVKNIFTKALIIVFYISQFPNLSDLQDEYNAIIIDNLFEQGTDDEVIKKYNELTGKLNNTLLIIKQATKNNDSVDKQVKTQNTNSFKKSPIYKAVENWDWDTSSIRSRDLQTISNILDTRNYGNDRNIFLYNINDLYDESKQKITYIFKTFYDFIMANPKESYTINTKSIVEAQYNKFKAVSSSFCIEVLLNLGSVGGGETITPQIIIDTMDSFMKQNEKIEFTGDDGKKETLPINNLLTDTVIISEDNAYNTNIVSKSDNIEIGINENQDEVASFEINAKQATIPLLNLIVFTENNIQNFKTNSQDALTQFEGVPTSTPKEIEETSENNLSEMDIQEENLNQPSSNKKESISEKIKRIIISKLFKFKPKTSIVGGSKIDTENNTKENATNLQLLIDSLPTLEKSETTTTTVESKNVFEDTTICYHPLVPLYLLTQAYNSLINNEDIKNSIDFQLYVNCFIFMNIVKELLLETYSEDNNVNKMTAYAIGLGLRELLFTSNVFTNRYETCKEILKADDNVYAEVYSLISTLSMSVSGKVTLSESQIETSKIFFESKMFKNFAESLDVNTIFTTTLDDINDDNIVEFVNNLKQQSITFSTDLAEQIFKDRKSTSYNDSLLPEPLSSSQMDISELEHDNVIARGIPEKMDVEPTTNIKKTSSKRKSDDEYYETNDLDYFPQTKKLSIDYTKLYPNNKPGKAFENTNYNQQLIQGYGGKTKKNKKNQKHKKSRKSKKSIKNKTRKHSKKNNKKSRKH